MLKITTIAKLVYSGPSWQTQPKKFSFTFSFLFFFFFNPMKTTLMLSLKNASVWKNQYLSPLRPSYIYLKNQFLMITRKSNVLYLPKNLKLKVTDSLCLKYFYFSIFYILFPLVNLPLFFIFMDILKSFASILLLFFLLLLWKHFDTFHESFFFCILL